jgi:hypothetical protein
MIRTITAYHRLRSATQTSYAGGTMKKVVAEYSTKQAVIDGSRGEGGGQILRNAISYACIFQQNLRIHHIRAKRSKPGLRQQHLTGLQFCTEMYVTVQAFNIGNVFPSLEPERSFFILLAI